MKPKSGFFILLFSGMALLSLACNLTASGGKTAASVETAVASTINALTPVAPVSVTATPDAHVLPTVTQAVSHTARVSFVDSAQNLYVWTAGTAVPIKLASSGDVVQSYVSSDGNLIVYTRTSDRTNYELDVINADGTNQRVLISQTAFAALPRPSGSISVVPYDLRWVPNSHRLGMSLRMTFEGPGLQILNTFYTVDADSGTVTPLFDAGENYHFAYSPDGAWLVIARPTGDDLYTAAGALVKANAVTNEFVNTASEYAWAADPVWQNDSSNFMLAIPPKEPWVDTPGPGAIWKVSNTGSAANTFTGQMSFFPSGVAVFDPTLSHMAFTTRVGVAADNNWTLHVAGVDGSADAVVDTGYFARLPVWSPDGSRFIYSKTNGTVNQAYLVLVDGSSAPVLLGDITSLLDIRWLDASRYIASSRTAAGASLLLGTVGSPSGVIFNDSSWNDQQGFSFDVNR